MADFTNAQQIDLTPQALAMIRLIQAGQSTVSDSRFTGRFGPGFPPMPVEPEVEPRLFQYQPGTNLMMIPRMGYNTLPFSTLRAMAGACKEIRINIEHIKRTMRGMDWEIIPNDKKKVVVGGKTYVATPETESVKKFFMRPDGINNFAAWLNMVLEEVLVTDALTLWPVQERGLLTAIELVDGTTIKPLLDMRGATPRPPMPAYLQIIWGTPQSSYPANTLIYRPLNTKVNTPYGESPIEWILTAINTAIRKDLSTVGYYAEGNIPGAFYTVPEDWTPEQIATFQSYIDAILSGDVSRMAKLLAVPGGTGSHVTQFQQNDPDSSALNEYLMKVACWAYGNNPAEFGITGGAGLGGAGFMDGAENIQQRSLVYPVAGFLEAILTEVIHEWLKRPDLRWSWSGLDPVEDNATKASADQANISMGVYTVAYVQDRDAIPQEYRPAVAPAATPQAGAGATLPMPLPPWYEKYLKAAVDGDLKKWEEKQLRAIKKGWGVVDFTSEVIPADMLAKVSADLRSLSAVDEHGVKGVFAAAGNMDLYKHHGAGDHKNGTPQSVHGGGGGKSKEDVQKIKEETVKEEEPEDLAKRDATESALSQELLEYFNGLADRVTLAVAEKEVLGKSDKSKDGEEETGNSFSSYDEQKAAFASMRERGTYDPSLPKGQGGKKKDGLPAKSEYTPKGTSVSSALNNTVTGKNKAGVETALRSIDKVHGDGDLPKINIERNSGKHKVGLYRYSMTGTSVGIKISSAGDHPAITTAHEIGHFIDHKGFEQNWGSSGSKLDGVLNAARESDAIKNITSGQYDYVEREIKGSDGSIIGKMKINYLDRNYKSYLLSKKELFARAYSQWIAVRSKDPVMLSELRSLQKGNENGFTSQWSDKDFEPIALEFDKLFKTRGWIE